MNSYWGRWNVCVQRCMFTYKAMCLNRFECTLTKIYVHSQQSWNFTDLKVHFQRWMYIWKVYEPFKYRVKYSLVTKLYILRKMNAHLKLNVLTDHLHLAYLSQSLYRIFPTVSCKSHNFYFIWKGHIRRIFLLFWNHVYDYRSNCTLFGPTSGQARIVDLY